MKIKVLFSALALSALMMDAQAHVTIRNYANGVDSIAGKSDHFRLNVPTNRGKAVTKVKMVVAEGVKLLFVHPMHGWTYTTEKNAEGNIVSITYTGRMEAGEFTAFPFIALNPKGDVSVKYKARPLQNPPKIPPKSPKLPPRHLGDFPLAPSSSKPHKP